MDQELLGASDASGPASCELGFVTSWSKPHMAPSYPQPTARLEPSLGPLRPPWPVLCWPLQPHLGPHPHPLSCPSLGCTWSSAPPGLCLCCSPASDALPPLPLSFFPPQPCLLSSWLPFPWVGLVPSARDTLLSLVALSLQLDQEPQRVRAWPILLGVWLTGDALYEFVEGSGFLAEGR